MNWSSWQPTMVSPAVPARRLRMRLTLAPLPALVTSNRASIGAEPRRYPARPQASRAPDDGAVLTGSGPKRESLHALPVMRKKKRAGSWRPGPRDRLAGPRLLRDDPAGDAPAAVAGGIGLVVVGIGVHDERGRLVAEHR